jgi:hypothetical protein
LSHCRNVEVDPVAETERLAQEAERERVWELVVAQCLESMPEQDRRQWVRERREQERLDEWRDHACADLARAKRDEPWADSSGSGSACQYLEY